MKVDELEVTTLDIRANRFDLLSRLANDLAHEVKNPLHAAVINLELLRRRVAAGETDGAIERAELLEDELLLAHQLIDTILLLLRSDHAVDGCTEVDTVIAELGPLLEAIARLERIRLRIEPVGLGQRTLIPAPYLRHVILGLVTATLETAPPNVDQVEIWGTNTENEILLTIKSIGTATHDDPVTPPDTTGGEEATPIHRTNETDDPKIASIRAVLEELGGRITTQGDEPNERSTTMTIAIPRTTRA